MSRVIKYLMDTDTCIYLLNGDSHVKSRVEQVGVEALAIALPSVGELYFGAYNSERVEANIARVRAFLTAPGPVILPIDEVSVEHFGRFKATLRHRGLLIGDFDLLIAGVAIKHDLTIVTNNTDHFERIPSLTLENWLSSPPQNT